MHSKRRQIPWEVRAWVDKSSQITNTSVSAGVLPNDSRANTLLNRAFHANMLSISGKRHRQLLRCDYQREVFLRSQRLKADTTMPGLLPYIRGLTKGMNGNTTSRRAARRYDPLLSNSFQSFASRFSPEQSSPILQKREISLERINRLALPKGHHQSQMIESATTVSEIFHVIANVPASNFPVLTKPPTPTKDKRFRQLVHLFSEVHPPMASNSQTVQSVLQSKSSLQDNDAQSEISDILASYMT